MVAKPESQIESNVRSKIRTDNNKTSSKYEFSGTYLPHYRRFQLSRQASISGDMTLTFLQPAPEAAIEYIHKQPVRWTHERVAVCDGGGGPLGHPRIFINVD